MMTPQEAADKAKEIVASNVSDREAVHVELDNLLCDILEQQGYTELVKVFNATPMWYA